MVDKPPFTYEYVMQVTRANAMRAVDISISKTQNRLAEFLGNAEGSQEILKTLLGLQSLKKAICECSIPQIKE
jgi:hypothetical protein